MAEVLSSAIDFLRIIKAEEIVKVGFIKKDGTQRTMKCTLDFTKIPESKKPKGIDIVKILTKINKSKILAVYDIEKKDWRSVPFDRLEFLETPSNNKVYKLNRLK
jgi:hypothetical protein